MNDTAYVIGLCIFLSAVAAFLAVILCWLAKDVRRLK